LVRIKILLYIALMNGTQTQNTMPKVKRPQLDLEEVEQAIVYFVDQGFIQELSGDKKHYVQRLIEYTALKKNNEAIVFNK